MAMREGGTNAGGAHKPRALILSMHPAPYRDPVFRLVHRREIVRIHVAIMFARDVGHSSWNLSDPEYPNTCLGKNWTRSTRHAFHPAVIRLLRRREFDVLLVPGTNHFTSLVSIFYCLRNRLPYLLSFDTVVPDRPHHHVFERLKISLFHRAAGFWVPGIASREYFSALRIPPARIFEGSYTLDEHSITRKLERSSHLREAIHRKFGIRTDGLALLMVANLLANRRHAFLLEAFFHVQRAHPETKLIIVGDGPEKGKIELAIESRGLRNVHLIAGVPFDDLAEIYSISDIYVHTGMEPYSTAVAFAAIAGIPIVSSSAIGASRDFVVDGATGYLVDDKVEHWVDALMSLLRNPAARIAMGRELCRLSRLRGQVWAAEQLEAAIVAAAAEGASIGVVP